MMPETELFAEEFEELMKADERLAKAVAAEGCVHCQGPLHVANYARKPRGAGIAAAGEAFTLRHSLCCGREGCRKRTLPPSLRFLGRRVYLEVVVLCASWHAQLSATLREAREATQVPQWTLRRWLSWWRVELPQQGWWAELRALLVPPAPAEAKLPASLLEKLAEQRGVERVEWIAARCLATGTTRSPIDCARFVRALAMSSA